MKLGEFLLISVGAISERARGNLVGDCEGPFCMRKGGTCLSQSIDSSSLLTVDLAQAEEGEGR